MVHASVQGWRPGRAPSLVLGALLAAGLLGALRLSEAAPPKADPAKKATPGAAGKGPAAKAPAVKGPTTLKMTIVAKDADVAEMAKLINTKLEEGYKKNKITPSFYVDDYEFLRRASLDIVGRIATPEEIKQYLKDPDDKRRSLLVERLLKHEDYARHWANLWSNWLLTRSGPFGSGTYKDQLTVWLEDQFARNKGYHEVVTQLLTAKGKNTDNGAVNFILGNLGEEIRNTRTNPKRVAEEGHFEMVPLTSRTTRLFLGTQVQCAQCHPHPFYSGMKQEQFWGVNAFLRQVRREGAPGMMRRGMVAGSLTLSDDESVNPNATVYYETRAAKLRMWKAEFVPPTGKDRGAKLPPKTNGLARREELAKYLVDHDMFAKAIVNRMWGLFFGRGFVNPIDDFNDNNQPSNPELLNALANRFKHYNYDLKKLIRWMAHSNAYHLSYVANKTNDKPDQEPLFSRMVLKAMSPEQLFESLMVATRAEVAESKAGKKSLREQWLTALVANFGDDEGNEVNFNGTVVQALMMMNGKDINDAIARKDKGTVAAAVTRNRTPQGVLNDLYLAALNRPPRPAEVKDILAKLPLRAGYRDTVVARYEDVFWALLNGSEFLLNH